MSLTASEIRLVEVIRQHLGDAARLIIRVKSGMDPEWDLELIEAIEEFERVTGHTIGEP